MATSKKDLNVENKNNEGVESVVEMLLTMDKLSREKLLDELKRKDLELVKEITKRLIAATN